MVGVGVAVAIIENPWVQERLLRGVTDLPFFPIAALRFTVTDAIRYRCARSDSPVAERVETRVSEPPALPLTHGYEHQVDPPRALDAARQGPPNG